MNTALEMDIYGNVNSSHVMNGVGAMASLPATVTCPFSWTPDILDRE